MMGNDHQDVAQRNAARLVTGMQVTSRVITCSTGSSAYFGRVILNGVRLGLAEYPIDHVLEVIECDDEGEEGKAIEAFAALADQDVAVVIGPVESHTAGAVLTKAAEVGLPVVSPAATASALTDENNPWFFRTTPSDYQKVEMLSRLLGLRHPYGAVLVFYESRGGKLMRRNDLLCGESIARDIARVFAAAGHVYTLLPFNRDLDQKALDDQITSAIAHRSFVGVVVVGRSSDTLRVTRAVRNLHGSCLITPLILRWHRTFVRKE